jgi:pimeloyl-ACP methyl ester carboxylesterase
MAFVLIHGGAFAATCWDPLMPLMPPDTLALDLPGRGAHPADVTTLHLEDFVDSDLESRDLRDVTLVAHSLGGATLLGVLGRVPERLARIVFVSALAPLDGQSPFETVDPAIQELSVGPDAPNDGGLDPDFFIAAFCNDMNENQTAYTVALMGAEAGGVMFDPVDAQGLGRGVPISYVRLGHDAILTPPQQDRMIENLGGHERVDVHEIDSGHMVMISRPNDLAAVLLGL